MGYLRVNNSFSISKDQIKPLLWLPKQIFFLLKVHLLQIPFVEFNHQKLLLLIKSLKYTKSFGRLLTKPQVDIPDGF